MILSSPRNDSWRCDLGSNRSGGGSSGSRDRSSGRAGCIYQNSSEHGEIEVECFFRMKGDVGLK